MPLSPIDIHNKEFTKSFRGYAEDEVNEFLDQIIKDYEILLREKKDADQQLEMALEQTEIFHFFRRNTAKIDYCSSRSCR